jgi:hypothetical protein
MNVQNFWRAGLSANLAGGSKFGAMNGVPVLTPFASIPTTLNTRTAFEVVDFASVPFNHNRVSHQGVLLYDTDSFGRMRPIFYVAHYECEWPLAAPSLRARTLVLTILPPRRPGPVPGRLYDVRRPAGINYLHLHVDVAWLLFRGRLCLHATHGSGAVAVPCGPQSHRRDVDSSAYAPHAGAVERPRLG